METTIATRSEPAWCVAAGWATYVGVLVLASTVVGLFVAAFEVWRQLRQLAATGDQS